jgi:hypothetical protein
MVLNIFGLAISTFRLQHQRLDSNSPLKRSHNLVKVCVVLAVKVKFQCEDTLLPNVDLAFTC